MSENEVVELFEQIYLDQEVLVSLHKIKELLFHQHKALIPSFIERLFLLQTSTNTDVLLYVFTFIEELCKLEMEDQLSEMVDTITAIYHKQPTRTIQKRAILSLIHVHRLGLKKFTQMDQNSETVQKNIVMWRQIEDLKRDMLGKFTDSETGGVHELQVSLIKLIESLVLAYTSHAASSSTNSASLVVIPEQHFFLQKRVLEHEAIQLSTLLMDTLRNHRHKLKVPTILVLVPTLTNLAKARPKMFFELVLDYLITSTSTILTEIVPASHLNNTKKLFSTQLMYFLKHPMVVQQSKIKSLSDILGSLGVSKKDIDRMLAGKTKLISLHQKETEKLQQETKKRVLEAAYLKERFELYQLVQQCPSALLLSIIQKHIPMVPPQLPPGFPGFGCSLTEYKLAQQAGFGTDAIGHSNPLPHEHNSEPSKQKFGAPLQVDSNITKIQYQDGHLSTDQKLLEASKTSQTNVGANANGVNGVSGANDDVDESEEDDSISAAQANEEMASTLETPSPLVVRPMSKELCMTLTQAAYKRILDMDYSSWGKAISRLTLLLDSKSNLKKVKLDLSITQSQEQSPEDEQEEEHKEDVEDPNMPGMPKNPNLVEVFVPRHVELLVQHVTKDFSNRIDLAITLLYHLYRELLTPKFLETEKINSVYEYCYLKLFQSARDVQENIDFASPYYKLLLEAPTVPEIVFDLVSQDCEDVERLTGIIITLRDLITMRPKYRDYALNILLKYVNADSDEIRSACIAVLLQIYTSAPSEYRACLEVKAVELVQDMIAQFAQTSQSATENEAGAAARVKPESFDDTSLDALSSSPPPSSLGQLLNLEPHAPPANTDTESIPNPSSGLLPSSSTTIAPTSAISEDKLMQMHDDEMVWNSCNLLFDLCTVNFRNISKIMGLFAQCETYHLELSRSFIRLIDKAIAVDIITEEDLLYLFDTLPLNSEPLLLKILSSVSNQMTFTGRVTDLLLTHISKNNKSASDKTDKKGFNHTLLYIPMIKALPFDQILHLLPTLLTLQEPTLREAFFQLFQSHLSEKALVENAEKVFLNAANLMIRLHHVQPLNTAVTLAQNLLFERGYLYTSKTMHFVLQRLFEIPQIPPLFMRTIIISQKLHHDLSPFVMNLMLRLSQQEQIWQDQIVYTGFIKLIDMNTPVSFSLLFTMNPEQLELVFRDPGLQSNFSTFMKTIPPQVLEQHLSVNPSLRKYI